MADLSDELRHNLVQLFCLGYWDTVTGEEITDDTEFPADMAGGIAAVLEIAAKQIDKTTDLISAVYDENPQLVHNEVYGVGAWLGDQVVAKAVSRN